MQVSPIASGCPFSSRRVVRSEAAAGAPGASTDRVQLSTKPLAHAHATEAQQPAHRPVPTFSLEQWKNAKHYDVVIAGAGIGGLYTAWRLQGCDGSQPAGKRIGMYERTLHLGGRIHTAKVAGAAAPMDVGAMRYVPDQQPLLHHLTEHFRIPTQTFVTSGTANLNYFRGQRIRQEEGEKAGLAYGLRPDERGLSPEQLLLRAFSAVIPNFAELSREELEKAIGETRVPVPGGEPVPLTQLGLQNVLARSLSREAIQYVTDQSGYETDLQNWDAGRAMLELRKGLTAETRYAVPREGMSAYPDALQHDLSRTRTDIRTNKTLRQVGYDAESGQFQLVFEDSGGAFPVTARELVLNLPQVPLQQVVADSPFLQGTALEAHLDKVKPNPLTRIFVTYDKPWWNDVGIQGGRSVTDLPLGQVYYYGDGKPGKKPYVEVYNDGSRSEFWEGLQNPGSPGASIRLKAEPQLVEELSRQLEEMHGRSLPKPTGVLYKRWSDPFFGAGWHTWNPGSQPAQTSQEMVQPLAGLPLYVCGEAYSTAQGWVEGALQTSEQVLQKMGKTD